MSSSPFVPDVPDAIRAVELVFKVSGLDKMQANIQVLERIRMSTGQVGATAERMGTQTARGADIASKSIDKLNDSVGRLASGLRNAVAIGTAFASIGRVIGLGAGQETQSMTLAGTLNTFGMGHGSNPIDRYQDSQEIADSMLARIRDNAARLPGETGDYMAALPGMLTPLARAGQNTDQIADFVSNITAVGSTRGIRGDQVGRDMSRILEGQASSQERMWQEIINPVLESRGITRDRFKAMSRENRVSTINSLMGDQDAQGRAGFGQMIRAAENTWSAQYGTFQSNSSDIVREGTSAVFNDIKDILKDINEYTGRFKAQFIEIVKQGGQLVRTMRPLLPLLAADRVMSMVTGNGILGNFQRFAGATDGWGGAAAGAVGRAGSRVAAAGRSAGGFMGALGSSVWGAAGDAAGTLGGWGRDGAARAYHGARGGLGRAAAWVGSSRPAGALRRAGGWLGEGAANLGNYVADGVWRGGPDSLRGWAADYTRGARNTASRFGSRIMSNIGTAGSLIGAVGSTAAERVGRAGRGALSYAGRVADFGSSVAGRVWGSGMIQRTGIGRAVGAVGGAASGLWSGIGGLASAAGSRMGMDAGGLAARTAGRFKFLTTALSNAASAAGSLGGRAGSAFAKILPAVGSVVGNLGKFAIYAAAIAIVVEGVKEIMRSAEAQRKIMESVDRLMGSFRVLLTDMGQAFGGEFHDVFKDFLPSAITKIVEGFTWIFNNAQALGRYLGDLAWDIMNPSAPRTRHNFDYYQAQVRVESAREAQAYHRERQVANARSRTGTGTGNNAAVNQDFRGSHIHLHNHFSPGYDPDRIAVSFTNRIGEMGRRRLQSNLGPLFSVR